MLRCRSLLSLFLALCAVARACAHDPYEMTAEAWLRADRVTLQVMMARNTAMTACGGALAGQTFSTADDFAAVREAFEKAARGLFVISGGGEKLVPREVEALVTVENDLEFKLVYPRPAAGPVRFDAVHLRLFDDPTYGVVLTVLTEGAFLGQQLLRAEESVMEVPLPSAVPPVVPPQT